jgi:hypothetical protein
MMTQNTFMGRLITVEMLSEMAGQLAEREALLADVAQALRAAMRGSTDQQVQAMAVLNIAIEVVQRIDAANLPYPTEPSAAQTDDDQRWHARLNRGLAAGM